MISHTPFWEYFLKKNSSLLGGEKIDTSTNPNSISTIFQIDNISKEFLSKTSFNPSERFSLILHAIESIKDTEYSFEQMKEGLKYVGENNFGLYEARAMFPGILGWVDAGEKLDADWSKLYDGDSIDFAYEKNGAYAEPSNPFLQYTSLLTGGLSFFKSISLPSGIVSILSGVADMLISNADKKWNDISGIGLNNYEAWIDNPYALSPKNIYSNIADSSFGDYISYADIFYIATLDQTVYGQRVSSIKKELLTSIVSSLKNKSRLAILSKLKMLTDGSNNEAMNAITESIYGKLLSDSQKVSDELAEILEEALNNNDGGIITENERININKKADELSYILINTWGYPTEMLGYDNQRMPIHHLLLPNTKDIIENLSNIEEYDATDGMNSILLSLNNENAPEKGIDNVISNISSLSRDTNYGGVLTRFAISQYHDAFPLISALTEDMDSKAAKEGQNWPESLRSRYVEDFIHFRFENNGVTSGDVYDLYKYLITPYRESLGFFDENYLSKVKYINNYFNGTLPDDIWKEIKTNPDFLSMDWLKDEDELALQFRYASIFNQYDSYDSIINPPPTSATLADLQAAAQKSIDDANAKINAGLLTFFLNYSKNQNSPFNSGVIDFMKMIEFIASWSNNHKFYSPILKANGGRATEASIFGEAGPEWAVPERHDARTAELLNSAREASGFSWNELIASTGGLNGGGNMISNNITYAPVVHANDARGVEDVLSKDKQMLDDWWNQKQWELKRIQWA